MKNSFPKINSGVSNSNSKLNVSTAPENQVGK